MKIPKLFHLIALMHIATFFAYSQTSDVCIVGQPKPELPPDYGTLDARVNILLRVEFLADGSIGRVAVFHGSNKSLSNLAVDAAKKIKFVPKRVGGKPIDTQKVLQYFYSWDGFWRIIRVPHVSYCSPQPRKSRRKT